ncbi:P-type DNA transfer ATPase VirB11 [Stenotrophomonas maltophilia]|jgi:type IV secretion system protein VirB11|nr:P-type DNA transfer ATPase VirB11 [Stenotrophomonas maltophilia]HEL3836400.1 P-type DNA transfer ATPase VirB11 [Stenotrophomonas maltophilia]HEL3845533.1 P-type DNA transfer ATPase VirB11 [Stenotrophomonas maltophilia]HEL4292564.1 P-type DNA transfer ATPase VirB11 [Stenotrophomonas maltophilia]
MSISPEKWNSVRVSMRELAPIIENAVGEVVINRPSEVLLETPAGWETREIKSLDFDRLMSIAKTIATASKQLISQEYPIISTSLDTGERVQIVIPPVVPEGTVSMVFRKPSRIDIPFEAYCDGDFFADARRSGGLRREQLASPQLLPHERELSEVFLDGSLGDFFRLAVEVRQNIVVSGPTGSGKTTFMKSLANLIPHHERLVTIEDAQELRLPHHANKVQMYYTRGGQGISKATAKDLLEATLRMYPSRVLLAELRGEEAWYYVRNVMSGHPGSVTSMHASDELTMFDQLTLLIKESAAGATISRDDLKSMLVAAIDITLQVEKTKKGRQCVGVYYNPLRKRGIDG